MPDAPSLGPCRRGAADPAPCGADHGRRVACAVVRAVLCILAAFAVRKALSDTGEDAVALKVLTPTWPCSR